MSQKSYEAPILRLNDTIMAKEGQKVMERDPKLHIGLNPVLLTIRKELHTLGTMDLQSRKYRLRQLLIEDFLQEDIELREVGLAYKNTQL